MQCFAEFCKIKEKAGDCVLLLVGEGELQESVRQQAESLGIADRVIFAGRQGDPAPYYQAMDVLLFPSHYEGLPGTIVESQASGLPALVSENVTRDVEITPLAQYLSLSESPAVWAREALRLIGEYPRGSRSGRMEYTEKLREAGFDVKRQVRMLEELYREMLAR